MSIQLGRHNTPDVAKELARALVEDMKKGHATSNLEKNWADLIQRTLNEWISNQQVPGQVFQVESDEEILFHGEGRIMC